MVKFSGGPGVIIAEEGIERLAKHTHRDAEFASRIHNWMRPEGAPRYDLDRRKSLIRWLPTEEGVLDVELFLRSLQPPDRVKAAEVAMWVAEEFAAKPATDKTLNMFRLNLLRRLDACGY